MSAEERVPEVPEAQAGYEVDLADVLKLAGSQATEIGLARARLDEARARADSELFSFLPEFAPRIAFRRIDGRVQDTGGTFLDVDKQQAAGSIGLELTVRPVDALYRLEAARGHERAAAKTVDAATQTTLLRAAEGYFLLVAASARVRIAQDAVRAARELVQVEKGREEAGAGLPASVARAEARRAETDGGLANAESMVARQSALLVELVALDPMVVLVPRVDDASVPVRLVDASRKLNELIADAKKRRPELGAARAMLDASKAMRAHAGNAWLFPELRLGAAFGTLGDNFADLSQQEDCYAAVQWRIDFGILSRHSVAAARARQAQLVLEATGHAVARSVTTSYRRIGAAQARMRAARREIDAAAKTLDLVRARQAEGENRLLEVLDAQSALTRARTTLVIAVSEHNAAQYALLRAVGGPR